LISPLSLDRSVFLISPDSAVLNSTLRYQAANGFLIASTGQRGEFRTALEALACGCPVITVQGGGVTEIVKQIEPSWIATGHSQEDWENTLSTFLKNTPRWPELRERCAHHVAQNHSLDALIDALENISQAYRPG
jgi:glycosyltransferase involved in cell wall biosynthesis